jgi:hypothetical protein
MKKLSLLLGLPVIALTSALAIFLSGCGKQTSTGPKTDGSKVASATKTSFSEVTSQLDPGGDFYLYLSTAQWLEHLSTKIGGWRQVVSAAPELKPKDLDTVNRAFDAVVRLVADSGIEDVTGVGLSSVEIEPGMFRNKAVLHHYRGKGDGFLWQLAGQEPHALAGLDLLPENTALAVFSDLDLPLFWTAVRKEVFASDFPTAKTWLDKVPSEFENQTKVKWDAFLNSLGGEFGLVLTLDANDSLLIPIPGSPAVEIPRPGLMLAVRVNDETIFNRIDQELKSNPQIVAVDKPGLKMRTLPLPLPFVGELRPSTASSGGYLLIATSDSLIDEALAVKAGQKTGLKATAEFKHLAQGIPDRGNNFTFMSERFAKTLLDVQQKAILSESNKDPKMAQWLKSFFTSRPAFAYSVGINTPEGCLTIGNGSQSYSSSVLLPALAVPGLLAAIAVPNFVKARATSQQNACINNLRQLDAAKNQWALENSKSADAVPTKSDLLPYLRSWPTCPQGGTYTLNPVDQNPTCSIPGHHLD